MVKSRRSASARQSRPKRTLAWRPKVSTSSRKRRHFERPAVDHDRDGAVLDAGRHRLEARRGRARRITSSGTAVVATSKSPIGSPSSALRTAPPTTRASSPSRSSTCEQARQRAFAQPRGVLQRAAARSPHTARARTCRPRHGPAHRSSPAARRRNARDRRSCRSSGSARRCRAWPGTFGGQDASVSSAALVATR